MGRRKLLHLNEVTVRLGCGCMKPKLTDIFDPKPRSSAAKQLGRKDNAESYNMKSPASVGGRFGRIGGEGLAVEKDSDDPYLDFRNSMLQMILENEIYSKDDMSELLNCFLRLNSPYHHGIIIRAFTELWNGVFYLRPAASPSVKPGRRKALQAAV